MQESNVTVVRNDGRDRAVVFLHGFTGTRDDTWDRFPALLGTATSEWDIFTLGYATTMLPDVVGIWSADPDLPILAKMFRGQLARLPFDRYQALTLIAHSMGGLIAQKAVVDDAALTRRVQHLILFGTPSDGLGKASWIHFWKRQLKNMSEGSEFIRTLRADWDSRYRTERPFNLLVVAGASDQFVPPSSSLAPFSDEVQQVVGGDHLSIVKPSGIDSPSLQLVIGALGRVALPAARDAASALRLAAERPQANVEQVVSNAQTGAGTLPTRAMIVDAALALERAGKRNESIALLERYQDQHTDVKASLGGRVKRVWYETGKAADAERALSLYEQAHAVATALNVPDQIYYSAINVAYMRLTFRDDMAGARQMATRALQFADPPGNDVWKTATVAEAYLYLDQHERALDGYRRLLTLQPEPWQHQSAALQAGRIAAKMGDIGLIEALEGIFTPGARQVNRIFVSYSHADREWLERLKKMASPYLRAAEAELDLWDDTRLTAGQPWEAEIDRALSRAGVAVALVSASFLDSPFIMEKELGVMVDAARQGGLQLLWVCVSSAGWEVTPLRQFQATHDPRVPLDTLTPPQQNEILRSVAQKIKEAALGATGRFRQQPSGEAAGPAAAAAGV